MQQKFPGYTTTFSKLAKMPKYLIDVNLPYYFSLWSTPDYIHQKDIDDEWSDDKIWQHAKENNLIIITKDKDFSIKQLVNGAPPKIIHIRFGNVNMKTFFKILTSCWSDVESLIATIIW